MLIYLTFFAVIFLVSNSRALPLRVKNGAALFLSFLFIGLRYETGFDWPTYKIQYEYISRAGFFSFFDLLKTQSLVGSVEPGFVATTFLASRFFSDFEAVAALYTLFFLLSTLKLGQTLGVKNIGMALVLIHLPLLFSLEFSTIRQSLAISAFNLGLAYHLEKRHTLSVVFLSLSPLFQVSGIMYLAVFLMATGTRRISWPAFIALISVLYATTSSFILLALASILPPHIGTKLQWYISERIQGGGIVDVGLAMVLLLPTAIILIHVLRKQGLSKDEVTVFRVAGIMSIVALAFVNEQTIRNRYMYEIVILVSLLAFSKTYLVMPYLRVVLLSFGTLMLSVYLLQTSRIAYIPYQNFIIWKVFGLESTGNERMIEYYNSRNIR